MPPPPRIPGFELLAISDRLALGAGGFELWLERLGAAGVGAVQIREKDLPDREILSLAHSARRRLPPDTTLLINGRADLARSVDFGGTLGIHLPSDGVPIRALRDRFGADFLIGRSAHSLDEVARAMGEGADYATLSPLYATPSKAAFGPPLGLGPLERAAALGLPLYALGGVTLDRLPELAAAGAAGIAGIRLFLEPTDLAKLVTTARALFGPHSPASSRPAP